jgi:glycosyltransferase involved in cell wall biosynthesis
MRRNPDQCRSRLPLENNGDSDRACCAVIAQITNVRDAAICGVSRPVCEACCRSLQPGEELNPVVASLVYQAASAIVRAGGVPGCDRDGASALRERIVNHLGVVAHGLPDRIFPPEAVPPADLEFQAHVSSGLARSTDRLKVGVLTAPRAQPLLGETLRSLHGAGFERLSIFAEPGTPLPPEARSHDVETHDLRLGNFTNFYNALASLYRKAPEAEGVILFQDDIEVAAGLKAWCDAELFPHEHGLVSLFTPRVHIDVRPGWRVLSPGYFRIFGGQALAFRRDVLEQFLTDPQVLREIRAGRDGDDAIVSGWATRRSLGIAFHTPSLVQHVGRVSSMSWRGEPDSRVIAYAVQNVSEITSWRSPRRSAGKVGLVGYDGPTGLGYQNEEMARSFDIDRWLIPVHSIDAPRTRPRVKCRVDRVPGNADQATIRRWMAGLDWIVFIERPFLHHLAATARSLGVFIALVANWEWMSPHLDWLRLVDLVICPTNFTYNYVIDFRKRFGFGWHVVRIPWPVAAERFPFRQRQSCERFLFVNGWGGPRATRLDGSKTPHRRKGMDVMVEAMWMAPRLNFLLYSQKGDVPKLPSNVELQVAPSDHRRLYDHGDVCVQPSHLEGLGLQLLECQAAGMPLITTDAPPMNEHNPWMRIPVTGAETVLYGPDQPVPWQQMDARQLASLLAEVAGTDIAEASAKARAFVESEHNWPSAASQLREVFVVP